mmetsp:Transcript_14364/g.40041  ORF Transcript_14364/g.40041 Transcript_14364/m.40041 type:complete len:345 (-) Transcript_14364:2420-3454(-)
MKLSIQILNHQDGLGAKIAFFQGFEIVVVFFSLATVRSFRKVGGQRNAFHNGTVLFIVAFRRKMQHQKCFQRPDRLVPSEPAIQLFPVRQPEPNSRTPRGSLGRFLAKQGPRSIEAARFLRDLSFLFILSSLFFSLRLQASLVSLPFPLLVLAQRFLVFLVLLATQLGFLFPLIPPARCLEDRSFVFLKRRGNQTRELQGSEFYQTQTLGLEDQLDRSLCDAARTRTRTGTIVVVAVAAIAALLRLQQGQGRKARDGQRIRQHGTLRGSRGRSNGFDALSVFGQKPHHGGRAQQPPANIIVRAMVRGLQIHQNQGVGRRRLSLYIRVRIRREEFDNVVARVAVR